MAEPKFERAEAGAKNAPHKDNTRQIDTLGTSDAPAPPDSVVRADFAAGLVIEGGRPTTGRRIASKQRKKRLWLRLLLWLIVVSACATSGYQGYIYYKSNIVPLDGLADETATSAGLTSTFMQPPVGYQGALNKPQIRWCLREEIRVQVLSDLVRTTREINRLSNIRTNLQSRCTLEYSVPAIIEEIRREVATARTKIVAETKAEQLSLLSAGNADTWSKSDLVLEIQQSLEELGYDAGGTDGLFGAQTQAAIKAFQRDVQQKQTGEANYDLLLLLHKQLGKSGN